MKRPDYTKQDVKEAYRKAGLKQGDVVFCHSNIAFFGVPEGSMSAGNVKNLFIDTLFDVIGPQGAFVMPTFSYTFPEKGVFDKHKTPSVCGMLSEIVRLLPEAVRSDDPIFSVAALGGKAVAMTENISQESFGRNSFWDRLYQSDGVVLNMNFGAAATYFHYIEKSLNVPYRFDKVFETQVRDNGIVKVRPTTYFCRDLSKPEWVNHWPNVNQLATERGVLKTVPLGRGFVSLMGAREIFNLIKDAVSKNQYFLTKALEQAIAQGTI